MALGSGWELRRACGFPREGDEPLEASRQASRRSPRDLSLWEQEGHPLPRAQRCPPVGFLSASVLPFPKGVGQHSFGTGGGHLVVCHHI